MNVYCLLAAMTDELKENTYVQFTLYDIPDMQTESVPVKEWLAEKHEEILKADVINFDIESDKNYGYLMFTIFITM
jgi:hypothetical protein